MRWEIGNDLHTTMCEIDSQWEPAVQHRELSSGLCDDLEGKGAERLKREGIYVYIQLIHFIVQQNQHNILKQLHPPRQKKKKKE